MKICFTTYIYGDNYQDYIPWILFTVGKSYPEYYTMLFINGSVREDLKSMINEIRTSLNPNFEIIEHTFDDCPKMNPIKAMSLRWVLWHEEFKKFDYLYYIDSDMLFIREPIPMHEQHIRHMNFIHSDCISNILRKRVLPHGLKNWYLTYYNFKMGGFETLFKQFLTHSVFRMSGIHFVKVKSYFTYLSKDKLLKYKDLIYTNKGLKQLPYYENEHFLYKFLQSCGIDLSVFAVQNTSISMFGMNNPEKNEFCPHHGIHMGIFREPLEKLPNWAKEQLESDDYKYYISYFKETYLNDVLFNKLLSVSPERIKITFKRMYTYYGIK